MSSPDVPVKNPRIAARVIDNKAIVVNLDRRRLHTLNQVGTRVWELCDGRSVDEIAEVLVLEFEVERESALTDVRQFVGELRAQGALMPQGASS